MYYVFDFVNKKNKNLVKYNEVFFTNLFFKGSKGHILSSRVTIIDNERNLVHYAMSL